MASKKDLQALHTFLCNQKRSVKCKDCDASLLPKDYEAHQASAHGFNPKYGCSYCKSYFWNAKTKYQHTDHLRACFKELYVIPGPSIATEESAPDTSPSLRLLDLRHSFPERVPFEIESDWPPLVLDPSFIVTNDQPFEIFHDANLNLAASYVLLYLSHSDAYDWYHVMVKCVAYPSFVEAMLADGGSSRTLLFFCLCDGGKDPKPRYRQHFHAIVISPKGHFGNAVWKKVRASEKPRKNFACKRKKLLESPSHFVNAMLYVSNRKSKCEFTFKINPRAIEKNHHFLLNRTLPIESALPLYLLFENGWERLLYQKQFMNASAQRILEHPLEMMEGQWKQRLKHFYGLQRGLVLPVVKGLAPTATPNLAFPPLYLADGRKLYFERRPEFEAMDEDAWLRAQAEGGNRFYDAMEEAWWTPRKRLQREINLAKPLLVKIAHLEAENANLEARNIALESRVAELERASLKRSREEEDDAPRSHYY